MLKRNYLQKTFHFYAIGSTSFKFHSIRSNFVPKNGKLIDCIAVKYVDNILSQHKKLKKERRLPESYFFHY